MSLSQRERLIVILTLVMAGLFLADRWVISPLWTGYSEDADRAELLEQDVIKTTRLLRHRHDIEARWTERQHDGLAAEVSVAEGGLLNHLERWAGQAGLTVSSMKPEREPVKKNDIIQRVRCRLIANGRMESIAKFGFALETAAFPVRLETMQMSSSDPQKDSLTVQFVVSTVCLVTKPDKPTAIAATKVAP
jgi:hypothetical protein